MGAVRDQVAPDGHEDSNGSGKVGQNTTDLYQSSFADNVEKPRFVNVFFEAERSLQPDAPWNLDSQRSTTSRFV